jgi:hypothetical protein
MLASRPQADHLHPEARVPVRFIVPDKLPARAPAGIPLLELEGPGTLVLRPTTVTVEGRQRAVVLSAALGVVAGLLTLVAAVIVLVGLDVARHLGTRALAMVGLLCGVAPGLLLQGWLRRRLPGRPFRLTLPRTALHVLDGAVVAFDVVVEMGAMRGLLCLAPADAADLDLLALGLRQGLASPVASTASRRAVVVATTPVTASSGALGGDAVLWAPDTLRTPVRVSGYAA